MTAPARPADYVKRRRRPPSPAEQARRKAWARQWAQVGEIWKQKHNPKGR